MKVRYGFVSNSSSSSFCMFGICEEYSFNDYLSDLINTNKYDSILKNLVNYDTNNKTAKADIAKADCEHIQTKYDVYDVLYDYDISDFEELMSHVLPTDIDNKIIIKSVNGFLYIGREWSSIGLDETGQQLIDNTEYILENYISKYISKEYISKSCYTFDIIIET